MAVSWSANFAACYSISYSGGHELSVVFMQSSALFVGLFVRFMLNVVEPLKGQFGETTGVFLTGMSVSWVKSKLGLIKVRVGLLRMY